MKFALSNVIIPILTRKVKTDVILIISVSMPNADIFAGGGIVEGTYIFNGVIQ